MAESFGAIKAISFACIFLLFAIAQYLLPFKSARILRNWSRNLPLAMLNTVVMGFVCAACVCVWAEYLKSVGVGLLNVVAVPTGFSVLIAILVLDLVAYFWHRAHHRFAFLWRFHSVHHSDSVFDASTAVRFHLGELLSSVVVRLAVVGLMGLSVVGILVFEVVFQLFNIFQHSNLALPVKWEKRLNYLFVGPAIHRRHHSVERDELNSNYATIFSFWDRLFTTRQEGAFSATIEYGIKGMGDLSLVKILSLPLQRDR